MAASGVAIGIFKDAEFTSEIAHLEVGDILVLYTTVSPKQSNNSEEEFGEERLEELVIQNCVPSSPRTGEFDPRRDWRFHEDQSLFDDATLVVIKRAHRVD